MDLVSSLGPCIYYPSFAIYNSYNSTGQFNYQEMCNTFLNHLIPCVSIETVPMQTV